MNNVLIGIFFIFGYYLLTKFPIQKVPQTFFGKKYSKNDLNMIA